MKKQIVLLLFVSVTSDLAAMAPIEHLFGVLMRKKQCLESKNGYAYRAKIHHHLGASYEFVTHIHETCRDGNVEGMRIASRPREGWAMSDANNNGSVVTIRNYKGSVGSSDLEKSVKTLSDTDGCSQKVCSPAGLCVCIGEKDVVEVEVKERKDDE